MWKPLIVLGSMAFSALLAVASVVPATAAPVRETTRILTWSVVHSPNRGAGANALNGVSCVSAHGCMAVGQDLGSTGALRTLAESWDGSRWSVVPSPNRGRDDNVLDAVSCVSVVACMASGYFEGGLGGTLAESWDGTRWSVLPSPAPGTTGGDALYGVSCVSADACMAVGAFGNSSGNASTLAESWDGARWSVVPSPNPVPGGGGFRGVSCVSKDACVAVGFSGSNTGVHTTLAESWNGSHWSVLPSRNPVTGNNLFNGVSCVSADACTAIGVSGSSTGVTSTLIESWDGSRWSVVPSPNPGPGFTWLDGVSCAAADACNATGHYFTQTGGNRTLIESWNGTRWSVVPHPQPGTTARELVGVSCVSTTTCTAAGFFFGRGAIRTLIETGTASGVNRN